MVGYVTDKVLYEENIIRKLFVLKNFKVFNAFRSFENMSKHCC